MTTASVMSTDVVTLRPDDRVSDALILMCNHKVHNLPVVGEDGAFCGLFTLRRLSHALLHRAAQLDQHSLLMHVNFMPDDTDRISERMEILGRQPVVDLLEKPSRLRLCTPDTPLPELLQLLYMSPTSVPVVVVENDTRRLAGMVSNWDVLTKLAVNLLLGLEQARSRGLGDADAPAEPGRGLSEEEG